MKTGRPKKGSEREALQVREAPFQLHLTSVIDEGIGASSTPSLVRPHLHRADPKRLKIMLYLSASLGQRGERNGLGTRNDWDSRRSGCMHWMLWSRLWNVHDMGPGMY